MFEIVLPFATAIRRFKAGLVVFEHELAEIDLPAFIKNGFVRPVGAPKLEETISAASEADDGE